MDPVKKKVLLDLFAAPSTLLPVVGGLSAWMLSWGVDGNLWLNLAGLVGVLGGAGLLATRLIFGLEQITDNAYRYLLEQRRQQRDSALDELERQLRRDQDPRTQTYLRNLRELYRRLEQDLEAGRLSGAARTVAGNVEKLFGAAVKHLEHSYHLWETAERMHGEARAALLQEREHVIEEVRESVEHLGKTIKQFHTFRMREGDAELAQLREELDQTMQVARRAEERVSALGTRPTYDHSEFE